jgi:hypothetical protein
MVNGDISQVSRGRPERLISWKVIAAELGCDERTAKRWERERGLPVYRAPGPKRSVAFAFRSELDAWLKAEPFRNESSAATLSAPSQIPESRDGNTAVPVQPRVFWEDGKYARMVRILLGVVSAIFLLALGLMIFKPWSRLTAGSESRFALLTPENDRAAPAVTDSKATVLSNPSLSTHGGVQSKLLGWTPRLRQPNKTLVRRSLQIARPAGPLYSILSATDEAEAGSSGD